MHGYRVFSQAGVLSGFCFSKRGASRCATLLHVTMIVIPISFLFQ